MADSRDRRKRQRENAKAVRLGGSALGGQFRTIVQRAQDRTQAGGFAKGIAVGDEIPLTYSPTATTYPGNGWKHPRTSAAGYDRASQTLRVQFWTNGALYDYHNVPPAVARQFRMTDSPGVFINTVLNGYDYERVN